MLRFPEPAPRAPLPRLRYRPAAALLLCALLLAAARGQAQKDPAGPYGKLDVFSHVLSLVQNNYVETVDETKLIYGAIEGMIRTLDPHSSFMDPRAYASLKQETDGEYGGVGLELGMRGDDLVVISPLADSPASRAGIQPGDRIVEVDGAPLRGQREAEVARLLNGPPGTRVVVTVLREGWDKPRAFPLLRDVVRLVSVEEKLYAGRIGVVRIKTFQDRTDQYLKKSLDALRTKAGGDFAGLVLDLRRNPGGLLDQAVKVADRFLSAGVIVTTKGRGGRHVEVERAHAKETEPAYPLVLLVDGGTASASEIVAGALQDSGRALLLGTQTFGKGSVQTVIELEDGSGLKLTVARYYTPSGRSIQEKGITPDWLLRGTGPAFGDDDGSREQSLPGHFKGEDPAARGQGSGPEASPSKAAALPLAPLPPLAPLAGDPQDDPQLQTALGALRRWPAVRSRFPALK